MPILDLYNHSEKRRNLAHFAALATLAAVDGEINPPESEVIARFRSKLDISDAEYKEVMKKDNKYTIEAPFEIEKRYERLYDFFRIIFADHSIDQEEIDLVKKYALAIGFSPAVAKKVIKSSIAIFTGNIAFEEYMYLMDNRK